MLTVELPIAAPAARARVPIRAARTGRAVIEIATPGSGGEDGRAGRAAELPDAAAGAAAARHASRSRTR